MGVCMGFKVLVGSVVDDMVCKLKTIKEFKIKLLIEGTNNE
jgi:hypothetical protein